jgi:CheY-like chemotaxis protein
METAKKKILIVDDEVALTRMLKLSLEKKGNYEVREENRARRAVDAAREFMPDLIVLDVVMPDMDGGDVAAKMQRDPSLRDIPIIFLTAIVPRQEAAGNGTLNRGGYLFVPKPVSLEALTRLIDEHTGGQKKN